MEVDPHTIQQILVKVQEQLRCPQCRKKVNVTLESLKVLGDDFAVMQMKCAVCGAHIMLYASLASGVISFRPPSGAYAGGLNNVSSMIPSRDIDLAKLRNSLKEAGGSFMKMFDKNPM